MYILYYAMLANSYLVVTLCHIGKLYYIGDNSNSYGQITSLIMYSIYFLL